MNREDIKATVFEIFEDLLDDDSIEITEETSRENAEEWDSLFHMAFMATVGEEFNIQFKTEDIVAAHDLGTIINLVEAQAQFFIQVQSLLAAHSIKKKRDQG